MVYDGPNPDMHWYLSLSSARNVTPRCPFASVERCPRYYQSLSLLGEAGSTKIPAGEDDRLKALWEKSDLWPRTGEGATSVSGGDNRMNSFSNYCPEVSYDRFHIFASGLYEHVGEIDRDFAQQRLSRAGVPGTDWRWTWWAITPMHFTECPLYSPLTRGDGLPARTPSEIEQGHEPGPADQKPTELLTLKPGVWGMNIDLKEAARRMWQRLKKR